MKYWLGLLPLCDFIKGTIVKVFIGDGTIWQEKSFTSVIHLQRKTSFLCLF